MIDGPNNERPWVSVLMPIRNESEYIRRSLGSVLAQDYPSERMDVLVIDGDSDDGTPQIVRALAQQHPEVQVRLLKNEARIVPTALNLGLDEAGGDVIIRVDGHCEIPPDYVRRCVDLLRESGAECVGGRLMTTGETPIARAIALAQSSAFGVGGVAFRTGAKRPTYVDTLAFGAYRRDVFDRIGRFDEALVRNQDDEFNYRLLQDGGKILMDPALCSTYYSRASLRGLWRQYFQYGHYKVRVIQKRRGVPSWRHLVPVSFVIALVVSVLLGIVWHPLVLLSVVGPYLVANVLASLWVARKKPCYLLWLPVIFATFHVSYGLGFLNGIWIFVIKSRLCRGGALGEA